MKEHAEWTSSDQIVAPWQPPSLAAVCRSGPLANQAKLDAANQAGYESAAAAGYAHHNPAG